jgi:hypothetical protein
VLIQIEGKGVFIPSRAVFFALFLGLGRVWHKQKKRLPDGSTPIRKMLIYSYLLFYICYHFVGYFFKFFLLFFNLFIAFSCHKVPQIQ